MKRDMIDSGVEWIGDIPKEWKVSRIKNVLVERNEKNDPVKTNDILSLTLDKGVIPYSEKKTGGNKAKEDITKYKLAYPNDIVLNSMNVVVGSVGMSDYFGCVSPVYYILYSKNNDQNINYYNFLFKSSVFQQSLMGLGNGIMMKQSSTSGKFNTIRLRIPIDRLKNVFIPVPPITVQKKVANFLYQKTAQIDSIIENTKQSIEELLKYKQSLITETVTKGLNKNVKMKDSGVEWIGAIPITSEVVLMKRLALKITDGAHVSPDVIDGKYKFVSVTNIKNEGIDFDNSLLTSEDSYNQLVRNGCQPDNLDILIGKDGSVGKSVVVNTDLPFVVASSLIILKPNDIINPYFLNYLIKSEIVQSQLKIHMKGSALKRVSIEKFKSLKVVLPPLEEQIKIKNFLDDKLTNISNLINDKSNLLEWLGKYKKTVIYEYVTGKKEVM